MTIKKTNRINKRIPKYPSLIILAALFIVGLWLLGRYKATTSMPNNQNSLLPDTTELTSPETTSNKGRKIIPAVLNTKNNGGVEIKLCYGSDFLPKGEIIAYSLTDDINYQADFNGTKTYDGNYYMKLPQGNYYFKYQAHASAKNPESFTTLYYTGCNVEKPEKHYGENCSPDLVAVIIPGYSNVVNICGEGEGNLPF